MNPVFKIVLLLFCICKISYSQELEIRGRVTNINTDTPLPYTLVTSELAPFYCFTDANGMFSIKQKNQPSSLNFFNRGYNPLSLSLQKNSLSGELNIKLTPINNDSLTKMPSNKEIWAPFVINSIINSFENTRPDKQGSFTCNIQNHLSFFLKETRYPTQKDNTTLSDSTDLRIKTWKEKGYLFNSQTNIEKIFVKPDTYSENIKSSEFSGLSDPIFNFVAAQLQNASFFDNFIKILDKKYNNPLSTDGLNKYNFFKDNTIDVHPADVIYVCSFTPKDSTDNSCLKGYFYIERNNLKPVLISVSPALPDSKFTFEIIHQFAPTDKNQWMLNQKFFNLDFKTGIIKTPVKAYMISGAGSSIYQNVIFNDSITIKTETKAPIDTGKHKQTNNFFNYLYHSEPLTIKDSSVYHLVDSVITDRNYNQRMTMLEALLYGFYPVGGINIDFKKMVSFTRFEGILLGLGIATNPKIFKYASAGGFFSYGLKSDYLKYGGFVQLFPDWYSDTKLTLRYTNNATETGGYSYLDDYTFNSTEYLRYYFIPKMDKALEKEVAFSFRPLKAIKLNFYLNISHKIFNNYSFLTDNKQTISSIDITEAGLQLKFSWGEKFMKTPRGKLISLGSKYPVVWFNFRKGIQIIDGEVKYDKMEAKISQKIKLPAGGTTQIQLKTGKIWGNVPLSNIYSALGCYDKIPFDVENYFATIRPKEFYSTEFLFIFLRHNFGTIFPNNKKFRPELHIVSNAGWGKMSNVSNHTNIKFSTMEKGYWESGILLHRILNTNLMSLGTGFYYRYGPYSFIKTIDNFAIKATFTYTL